MPDFLDYTITSVASILSFLILKQIVVNQSDTQPTKCTMWQYYPAICIALYQIPNKYPVSYFWKAS